MTDTFDLRPAVREQTPLLVGIVSPSGAGKTYSALRLATGIQRVCGGDIAVIDTEQRRALHYAKKFKYLHMPFGAPFGPLRYLAAIKTCIAAGVKNIVVDSASHEHDGPGGVLEMHEAALNKRAGNDWKKREKLTFGCWAEPKQQRRKLIQEILQMNANFIFCFRAKKKILMVKGQDPVDLGFQAISGDEWIFEMQIKLLLLPGSDGVPTLQSEYPGEQLTIKMPGQFREFFAKGQRLDEDIGEKLARWAAGDTLAAAPAPDLIVRFDACADSATWRALSGIAVASAASWSADDKARVKQASVTAKARIEAAAAVAAQVASELAAGEVTDSDNADDHSGDFDASSVARLAAGGE